MESQRPSLDAPGESPMLRVNNVARRCNLSARMIRYLAARGELPAYRS
jgi:hypothetical protein